ncbi:MAG: SDR family oxidoreductase, partial [Pseudomonadota bacterium]
MSKIALVTGASSGIGRNAALSLAKAGWTVVGTGRRQDALDETGTKIEGDYAGIAADVTDEASVDALFAEIGKRYGRLDFVFNNAGNNVPATNFGDLTLEQWTTVIDVNLTGAFLIANRAFRMMRDQQPSGGRIVNNGSISAYVPRPGSAPYTASKHAITGLTRSISLDGRHLGIACGQIDPLLTMRPP